MAALVKSDAQSAVPCYARAAPAYHMCTFSLIDCLAGHAGGGAEQRRVGQHARQDSNIQLLLRGRDDN